MITATAGLIRDEIVRRRKEIYERDIRPLIEAGIFGCLVVIGVRSGEYEPADDALSSSLNLRTYLPGAQIFILRIGRPRIIRGQVTIKSVLPAQPGTT